MGFFDRFRRKHETTVRASVKQSDTEEVVAPKKEGRKSTPPTVAASPVSFPHGVHTLLRPLMTEKSERGRTRYGQYTFYADPHVNKHEIARAFYSIYGVKPVRVHVQQYDGEEITFRRVRGTTKKVKKAVITIPKGKTIDIVPTTVSAQE